MDAIKNTVGVWGWRWGWQKRKSETDFNLRKESFAKLVN